MGQFEADECTYYSSTEEEKEKGDKIFKMIMDEAYENLVRVIKIYRLSLENPSIIDNTPMHIIVKLLKTKVTEKILKANRKRGEILHTKKQRSEWQKTILQKLCKLEDNKQHI